MEKKQYDEIITTLLLAHRDDLAQALAGTTGFELCQQIEQLRDECTELAKQLLAERNQAEQVRNDLSNTYRTITQLRGQGLCSHATGKHDEECDIVSGLSAELKEARSEVFDLYHQACCVKYAKDENSLCEYDNACMSCYEYAEEKLIEWGLLKSEQCLRCRCVNEKEEK